jgi:hypothetical protein
MLDGINLRALLIHVMNKSIYFYADLAEFNHNKSNIGRCVKILRWRNTRQLSRRL